MITRRIPITELAQILMESTQNASEPKLGKNVASDDKKNNEKGVKDMMKATADYNKVAERNTEPENENGIDYNCTTLEYRFTSEPPKSYKDRVKKLAVNGSLTNDTDESTSTKGNEKFYNNRKEISNKRETERKKKADAGLVGRELKDDEQYSHKSFTVFAESANKATKRLHFKNTTFLTEADLLKRIPDDYKKKDDVFCVKDASGTEYMLECKIDPTFKIPQLKVIGSINDKVINEQFDRINQLSSYDRSDFKNNSASCNDKVSEMHEMLEAVRRCQK